MTHTYVQQPELSSQRGGFSETLAQAMQLDIQQASKSGFADGLDNCDS
jgi:hypothetical protein